MSWAPSYGLRHALSQAFRHSFSGAVRHSVIRSLGHVSDRQLRTREERVRRAAARQEIVISKTRRFDRRAVDYNTWSLDDPRRGRNLTGLTLDQVEQYLDTGEPEG